MLLHSQFILREAKYHFFIYCMKKQKMRNINITNKYLYASIAKKNMVFAHRKNNKKSVLKLILLPVLHRYRNRISVRIY